MIRALRNMLVAGLVGLAAPSVQACSACFGKTDSPLAKGMNAGIFVLLGFVLVLWIAFGSFFVFIVRRGRSAGAADPTAESGSGGPDGPDNPITS